MRKKSFVACLFCGLFFSMTMSAQVAQKESPFKAEDFRISWQQVFFTELDSTAVVSALTLSGTFDDIKPFPGGVVLHAAPHDARWQKTGLARGEIAMYVLRGLVDYRAKVEIRPGRYRVTVTDIVFIQNGASHFGLQGERTPLEEYALDRKGEIRKGFYSMNAAAALECEFTEAFTVSAPKADEDW